MSHSLLAWHAAGTPDHQLPRTELAANCATCGAQISSGISISEIETPTTAGHAELFRFGGSLVCDGCAWLFNVGKGRPGNFIVYGTTIEYTVISLESVVADKRPWIHVLSELERLPKDTPVTGVMTTDVKPRLWHRARLTTIGNFGLYVHAPDYDVSEWREFDLSTFLQAAAQISDALAHGFSKTSCYHGLLRDHARFTKDPHTSWTLEQALSTHRRQAYFVPALIAAGVTKERKHHERSNRSDRNTVTASASSDSDHQTQFGLL